jgi:hypothetical protein
MGAHEEGVVGLMARWKYFIGVSSCGGRAVSRMRSVFLGAAYERAPVHDRVTRGPGRLRESIGAGQVQTARPIAPRKLRRLCACIAVLHPI